jgi:molecular chaperone GrpE (heat shock protein)
MVDLDGEVISPNDPALWVAWWRRHFRAAPDQLSSAQLPSGGETAEIESKELTPTGSRLDHLKPAETALRAPADDPGDQPTTPGAADRGLDAGDAQCLRTALREGIAPLMSAMADLRTEVLSALKKTDRSGAVIERLEDELQALKRRDAERQKEVVFKDLAGIYDDVCSVVLHARSDESAGPPDADALLKSLSVFQTQLLEVLRRNGVNDFQPEPGTKFDLRAHEALATIDAADEAQDMCVAVVLRPGFEHAARVMRPAGVTVYRYRRPPSEAQGPGEQ